VEFQREKEFQRRGLLVASGDYCTILLYYHSSLSTRVGARPPVRRKYTCAGKQGLGKHDSQTSHRVSITRASCHRSTVRFDIAARNDMSLDMSSFQA
jgi:hypothetical protein